MALGGVIGYLIRDVYYPSRMISYPVVSPGKTLNSAGFIENFFFLPLSSCIPQTAEYGAEELLFYTLSRRCGWLGSGARCDCLSARGGGMSLAV